MTTLLRTLNALLFVGGIGLALANIQLYMTADLTGGGSTIHAAASDIVLPAVPVASFVPGYEQVTSADELVIGILLIFLGFFLHAFIVSQAKQDERNVPITVMSRAKKVQRNRMYWMEMRV